MQVESERKIRAQTRNLRFWKAPQNGAFEEADFNKNAHVGGFRANVRVLPPVAYFNRQAPRAARHAASVRNILSSRKLR